MSRFKIPHYIANRRTSLVFALLAGCNGLVPGEPAAPQSVASIDGLLTSQAKRPTELTRPEKVPPPLSGGSLTISRDNQVAVAGNPEADKLYFAQLMPPKLLKTVSLPSGTEPARIVETSDGKFAIVARGQGAVLLFHRNGTQLAAQTVCPEPRGITTMQSKWEGELLYVTCASGDLVKLQPKDLKPLSVKRLPVDDLRDIVYMRNSQELLISRFHSAQLLRLTAQGEVIGNGKPVTPGNYTQSTILGRSESEAKVARRLLSTEQGDALFLFQQHIRSLIPAYIGCEFPNCPSPILPMVTRVDDKLNLQERMVMPGATLATDLAVSKDGAQFLAVAAGNFSLAGHPAPTRSSLLLGKLSDLQAAGTDHHQEVVTNGFVLKPIAAAPLNQTDFVVLTRGKDPSLYKVDGGTRAVSLLVNLDDNLPVDEGMEMFHAATPAGLACASCHAEGGDDGHVWTQQPRGRVLSRRTKSLLGGLIATKPFRWDGTHTDLLTLSVEDMKNMGVNSPNLATIGKMAAWLDKLPAPWSPPTWTADKERTDKGKSLYQELHCGNCHNAEQLQVTTGSSSLAIKTPSLAGVGGRAPYFHGGCATSLEQVLDGTCAGNDAGGGGDHKLQLSPEKLQQLVTYLRTL
jgi:mono/diheme cytochrome c family protein